MEWPAYLHTQEIQGRTLSTKIKSQYQFYGFKTITVNQGEEKGALKEEVGRLLETGMHQMSLAETDPVEVVEPAAVVHQLQPVR